MFGFIFRGFLFLSIVTTYTLSVWNLICGHFVEQFNKQIRTEKAVENNNISNVETDVNIVCTKEHYFASMLEDYISHYRKNTISNVTM